MKVYLDNDPLDVSPATIREAITRARASAEEGGRLIIEVTADGAPMPGEMLDDPPEDDAGFAEIRLISAVPGAFVRETLLEAGELVSQLKLDQDKAAELIQGGSIQESFEPLERALTAWGVVRDVLDQSSELVGLDTDTVHVGDVTGTVCIEQLSERLAALKQAVASQDWAGASDELAYEMDGLAERWNGLLRALADQAMDPGTNGAQ